MDRPGWNREGEDFEDREGKQEDRKKRIAARRFFRFRGSYVLLLIGIGILRAFAVPAKRERRGMLRFTKQGHLFAAIALAKAVMC